jgi:hypothetical protein
MAEVKANKWVLEHYKPLTKETVLAIMDEIEAHIIGAKSRRVLSSLSEAYALASRFEGVLYRPFYKQKPMRILRAIIDRCGEAYYKKNPDKLYIRKEVVDNWMEVFNIPPERAREYLAPLICFRILEPSDKPEYMYKVGMKFFQLVGSAAQYYIAPVDAKRYREMTAIANGISSIYVVAHAVKSKEYIKGPRIPWFLKLSMVYTLSGLENIGTQIRIKDILELERINDVDSHFVNERGYSSEYWRSIRTEAFEFMTSNDIIEDATPEGYKLNKLWVKMHEEGVNRYIQRLRERYEKRYRGL